MSRFVTLLSCDAVESGRTLSYDICRMPPIDATGSSMAQSEVFVAHALDRHHSLQVKNSDSTL